jgi:hypothetical protein
VRPPLCLLRVTIQVPRQKPLRAKSGARMHDLIPRNLSHRLLHWLAGRTERGWQRGLRRRISPGEGGRPPPIPPPSTAIGRAALGNMRPIVIAAPGEFQPDSRRFTAPNSWDIPFGIALASAQCAAMSGACSLVNLPLSQRIAAGITAEGLKQHVIKA